MRFKSFCLIFLLFIAGFHAIGQQNEVKQPRILILLDGSSSMLEPWIKDENRFKAASKIISSLIDSVYKVNNQVEFALRVYGHQSPAQDKNCYDTRLEVNFSKDNLTQMQLRLDYLHPYGVTPIAFSLKQSAENDMVELLRNEYSIILITDGGESCGGDLCDVVRTLLDKKINFRPYILSLVDYAPLREQYKCLGNYLVVTSENEIKTAVGTIVDAYKPMFTLKPVQRKLIEKVAANPPSVLKMDIPPVRVEIKDEPIPAEEKKEPVKPAEKPPVVQPEIKQPAPTKDLTDRSFEPRRKEYLSSVKSAPLKTLFPVKFSPVKPYKPVVVAFRPPVLQPDPPAPRPITPPVKNVPPATTANTPAHVDVTREDAQETTLEIYFWDGKGKYYHTSPQIILTDLQTKKVAHKFYRTVGPTGSPDPRKDIAPGSYELTIAGTNKIYVQKIDVIPNKKNVIKIIAAKASLRFEYEDNPQQPVKEYVAQVKKNFENGPIIDQYCYQELEYEPGNYHIVINTLPVRRKSVDLEVGALVTIRIEKPGFVQFTNTEAYGKIKLYYELGDQFIEFPHSLEITGNPDQQKLELQRGRYRVGYRKNPGIAQSPIVYKDFVVKSKMIAEVQLD